ncbi:MAG: HIT family protein [Nanoarchaeota archaeon]
MEDCIFCKIIKGEIPSHQLFEDEIVKVFLDVNPVSKGHLLVIPKEHYVDIFETPEHVLCRINEVCKKMAQLCKSKLGATGVNVVNASGKDAQQSVFHTHYHVVPRFPDDGIDLWFHGKSNSMDELKEIQEKFLEN